MLRWIVPVLAFAAFAPMAAACSLVAPLEGPGAFVLLDIDSGREDRVLVERPGVGAMCELSNAHALSGSTFVWLEGRENESVLLRTDLEARATDELLRRKGAPWPFSVEGDTLLYRLRSQEDFRHVRIVAADLTTGATRDVPIPSAVETFALGGAVAAGVANGALYVHDARTDRAVVDGAPLRSLGLPEGAWLSTSDGSALLFLDGSTPWVLDLATLQATRVDNPGEALAIAVDGGAVYFREPNVIWRRFVADGVTERVATGDVWSVLSIQDGRLVVGLRDAKTPGDVHLATDSDADREDGGDSLEAPPGPPLLPRSVAGASALAAFLLALALVGRRGRE